LTPKPGGGPRNLTLDLIDPFDNRIRFNEDVKPAAG
jgi:hypothetical protein